MRFLLIVLMSFTAGPMLAGTDHSSSTSSTPSAGRKGAWEQISDEDGVVTFQRREADSAVISLRGEGVLPAPPEELFQVMQDNDSAHLWIPYVNERRDLKIISPSERVEYTELHLPWPLSPRYFISAASVERLQGGQMRVVVKSVDRIEPSWHHSAVLGELHYSAFVLTPVLEGKGTLLVLEVNSDLAGSLPKWLINSVQRSWPREFITGLRAQLERERRKKPADEAK